MNILIAFDSFKGSLSSRRAGELLEEGLKSTYADATCQVIAVADGGEGSLEMIKTNKQVHSFIAQDPINRPREAYFLYSNDTAYIEMAITSGLTLLKKEERDPLITNTNGLGQQIKEVVNLKRKKIIVFAGGSATNDAGLGALQALGFKFYTKNKEEIDPWGVNMQFIHTFDYPNLEALPEICVATDVTNPLYGPNGATHIYGPQKGATQEDLAVLEKGIKHISSLFPAIDINTIAGSGAAGGLAGGFHLFLKSKIVSATDILFNEINLNQKVQDADIVITGEGKLDSQSLNGKLVSKITDLSNQKKFIILAGEIQEGIQFKNVIHISSLKTEGMSTEEAMQNAEALMVKKGKEIGLFLKNKFV
jgi:glycerate kinase